MKERYLLAGNWKMNCNKAQAMDLVEEIKLGYNPEHPPLILAPPYPWLMNAVGRTSDIDGISIGAQNCHQEDSGAYTGEVAASMLTSCGVSYVIIGHSERRLYFKETDQLILKKIKAALKSGLKVIYCCGEGLEVRQAGDHIKYVSDQIENSLFSLTSDQMKNVVIAYEPIWAIGTGQTAAPEQAQEIHSFLRNKLKNHFGDKVAYYTTILYGGSCKPRNAVELFLQEDVDGGLIGGASLNAHDFLEIASCFPE